MAVKKDLEKEANRKDYDGQRHMSQRMRASRRRLVNRWSTSMGGGSRKANHSFGLYTAFSKIVVGCRGEGGKEDMHTTSLVSLQSSCVGSYSTCKEPVDDESYSGLCMLLVGRVQPSEMPHLVSAGGPSLCTNVEKRKQGTYVTVRACVRPFEG